MAEVAELFPDNESRALVDPVRAAEKYAETHGGGVVGSPRLSITREAVTYQPDSPYSFVRDVVLSRRRSDLEARARLDRHTVEMRVEYAEREKRAWQVPRDETGAPLYGFGREARAVSWIAGEGGDFAWPLWLIEDFATAPRPEACVSRLAPTFPLPVGPQSINLPRWTTGTSTGVDVPGSAPGPGRDIVDAAVTSEVVTIAGNSDVPIQMIEQSPLAAPFDRLIFADLRSDYVYQLESQILSGTGTSNFQLVGILPSTPSIAFSGAAVATTMFPYLGQLIAYISKARRIHMQGWMMTASRLAWLATSEDTSNRPLLLTDNVGEDFPIASLAAYNVYLNEAIPTTFGTGGNQDVIIGFRWDDLLLLESDARMQVMPDVLSGSLDVRLQFRAYVAFLNRYPSSIATVGGTGFVVQSGF